eukprot:gnl/MRDRNA2_/MRDRNA2_56011_c0_seq1.p1 gnl/MRDRNA2_/MRDRNA2_56011_c0~~gnl/MRDRNA2_/MRDRNA2_56011_c0_seq1.p1  ORF type:complete len:1349 (+),score=328.45 gnl/MRDRNA2_/MRDRNA2_56011_c0_seq1:146-4192(+)
MAGSKKTPEVTLLLQEVAERLSANAFADTESDLPRVTGTCISGLDAAFSEITDSAAAEHRARQLHRRHLIDEVREEVRTDLATVLLGGIHKMAAEGAEKCAKKLQEELTSVIEQLEHEHRKEIQHLEKQHSKRLNAVETPWSQNCRNRPEQGQIQDMRSSSQESLRVSSQENSEDQEIVKVDREFGKIKRQNATRPDRRANCSDEGLPKSDSIQNGAPERKTSEMPTRSILKVSEPSEPQSLGSTEKQASSEQQTKPRASITASAPRASTTAPRVSITASSPMGWQISAQTAALMKESKKANTDKLKAGEKEGQRDPAFSRGSVSGGLISAQVTQLMKERDAARKIKNDEGEHSRTDQAKYEEIRRTEEESQRMRRSEREEEHHREMEASRKVQADNSKKEQAKQEEIGRQRLEGEENEKMRKKSMLEQGIAAFRKEKAGDTLQKLEDEEIAKMNKKKMLEQGILAFRKVKSEETIGKEEEVLAAAIRKPKLGEILEQERAKREDTRRAGEEQLRPEKAKLQTDQEQQRKEEQAQEKDWEPELQEQEREQVWDSEQEQESMGYDHGNSMKQKTLQGDWRVDGDIDMERLSTILSEGMSSGPMSHESAHTMLPRSPKEEEAHSQLQKQQLQNEEKGQALRRQKKSAKIEKASPPRRSSFGLEAQMSTVDLLRGAELLALARDDKGPYASDEQGTHSVQVSPSLKEFSGLPPNRSSPLSPRSPRDKSTSGFSSVADAFTAKSMRTLQLPDSPASPRCRSPVSPTVHSDLSSPADLDSGNERTSTQLRSHVRQDRRPKTMMPTGTHAVEAAKEAGKPSKESGKAARSAPALSSTQRQASAENTDHECGKEEPVGRGRDAEVSPTSHGRECSPYREQRKLRNRLHTAHPPCSSPTASPNKITAHRPESGDEDEKKEQEDKKATEEMAEKENHEVPVTTEEDTGSSFWGYLGFSTSGSNQDHQEPMSKSDSHESQKGTSESTQTPKEAKKKAKSALKLEGSDNAHAGSAEQPEGIWSWFGGGASSSTGSHDMHQRLVTFESSSSEDEDAEEEHPPDVNRIIPSQNERSSLILFRHFAGDKIGWLTPWRCRKSPALEFKMWEEALSDALNPQTCEYVIAKDEQLRKELKEKGYQTRGKAIRFFRKGEEVEMLKSMKTTHTLTDGSDAQMQKLESEKVEEKVEVEWPNQQVGGEPLLQEVEKGKVQSASFVYLLYTDGLGTEAMHFDALLPYDLPKYKASVPNPFTDPPDGEEYFFQEDFIPDIFMARIGPRQEGDEDWVKLDQGWYAKDNSQTAEVCMLVVIALIAFSAITFAVFRLHRGASDHPGLGEVDKVIRHENVKSWTEHSRVSSATDA